MAVDSMTMFDTLVAGPNNFDYEKARIWMMERKHWSYIVVALYLSSLFAIKHCMKDRKGYSLRGPLMLWNSILAVFSGVSFWYCMTEYLEVYESDGFLGTYCHVRDFFRGSTTGYIELLFTLSKIVELGDSYFLVLRKRPLTFLQYYHHALTLIYCWGVYAEEPVYNRIGTLFNLAVHSVMYTYFFLRAATVPIPGFVARSITAFQISQFVINTGLLFHGWYLVMIAGKTCDWPRFYGHVAVLMNFSYLVLFSEFFVRSYVKGQHRQHIKKE